MQLILKGLFEKREGIVNLISQVSTFKEEIGVKIYKASTSLE